MKRSQYVAERKEIYDRMKMMIEADNSRGRVVVLIILSSLRPRPCPGAGGPGR